jgi:two-component system, OmpR family, KDP operon response regulator KdpE
MIPPQGKLLIVDDDPSIRRVLVAALTAMGFEVAEERTGERAIELLRKSTFDAVLLDLNMPGLGGLETCRELRKQHPKIGILMLTVRDSPEDKVQLLDAGADDYITKPFILPELAARIRSTLRRVGRTEDAHDKDIIQIDDLKLDIEKRLLRKGGQLVRLTPKEFDLLHYLMSHAGIPIPHARLLQSVWGPEYGGEVEYLRTFVRQLRKKIGDDASEPVYIKTDPYVGYRFRDPAD